MKRIPSYFGLPEIQYFHKPKKDGIPRPYLVSTSILMWRKREKKRLEAMKKAEAKLARTEPRSLKNPFYDEEQ